MVPLSPETCHCRLLVRALRKFILSEWRHNSRVAMKLFSVHSILWSSFLILCAKSETEGNSLDVCQEDKLLDETVTHSLMEDYSVEEDAVMDKFLCLLYPTNILNCSWSFHTLHDEAQLFVYLSICDRNRMVHSPNRSLEKSVDWKSLTLQEYTQLYVILQFNVTLQANWTVYTHTYNKAMMEVLSPPQNISALVKDGDLLVTWGLPYSQTTSNPLCFEYKLDMGDQEIPKTLSKLQSYTEPNADPSRTYKVRIRTKKRDTCHGNGEWSEWSRTVTVERSIYKLNTLVIVVISLGIPMILLAVLLVVRSQRVTKVLFPPIPRPPPKYMYFLEKNDTFSHFHPTLPAEPVEEITEVEDTE